MAQSTSGPPSVSPLQTLRWLDRRHRLRWYLLVPVLMVAALLEAAGALAVFGLLRLVVEPGRVRTTPGVSQIWPDDDPAAVISLLIGVVAVFYVLRALFLVAADWLKHDALFGSAARAAARLYARYLAADYAFHLRRRSAALIEQLMRSAELSFQLVTTSYVNIAAEGATILALVAVLVATAPPSALGGVALVLIVAGAFILLTRRLWSVWGEALHALHERQLHLLQQSLGAIKDVIVSGRRGFFEEAFCRLRRDVARIKRREAVATAALRLAVETVLILSMLLVVYLLTRQRSGPDTVSLLALFAYTGFRVVPSANRIMLNAGHLREGAAFARAFDADMRALASPAAPDARPAGAAPVSFADAIRCEGVTLVYEPGAPPALSDITLAIRRGESIGIVGPTGAGKSSLVDVLLGLLRPTRGRVTVDGVDLAGRERAWLDQVGYVPQDPYLLDDTIRRNIAFGIPDGEIDEARVARAAALAQLDDVLRQRPGGLDAELGESGARLSGGQRQRIAIARALYRDPAVLVFDEATAALDAQTEREVTRAIAALHGTRTLIVIAHRLTTVEACDRLVYVRDGRLAGVGRYQELLADPAFRAMVTP
ncbi:MAG: ABC transporter ATP-binding protein [Acidobacteriota bacterium]